MVTVQAIWSSCSSSINYSITSAARALVAAASSAAAAPSAAAPAAAALAAAALLAAASAAVSTVTRAAAAAVAVAVQQPSATGQEQVLEGQLECFCGKPAPGEAPWRLLGKAGTWGGALKNSLLILEDP